MFPAAQARGRGTVGRPAVVDEDEIIDVAADLDGVVWCGGTLVARYVELAQAIEAPSVEKEPIEEVGNGRDGALPVAFLDHDDRTPILGQPARDASTASSGP